MEAISWREVTEDRQLDSERAMRWVVVRGLVCWWGEEEEDVNEENFWTEDGGRTISD